MDSCLGRLTHNFLNRPDNLLLGCRPVEIAILEHAVSPDGGLDWSILAVLVDELLRAATDVEVGGRGRKKYTNLIPELRKSAMIHHVLNLLESFNAQ